MDIDQVVLLGRMMLQEVIILAGPILAVAIVVSLVVNVAAGADFAAGHNRFYRCPIDCDGRRAVYFDAVDVASSGELYAFNIF